MNDERILHNYIKALSNAATIAILFISGKIIYLLINDRASFQTIGWDITLLIIMSVTSAVSLYRMKDVDMPKSLIGRSLSIEQTKIGIKQRITQSYLPKSVFYSILFSLFDMFYTKASFNWTVLMIDAVIYFVIFFILSYFWYEHQVRRYNRIVGDE